MTTFTNDSLIQDSILDCIKERAAQDFKNIQKEKTSTRCQSFAFGDLGSFGEELALYMYPNSIGSGSKGGCAFDNKEVGINMETIKAREVKCVSLDGSKECVSEMCKGHKRKAPRFQTTCSYCGESNFKLRHDSRCGISAKAHMDYHDILSDYILIPCKYEPLTDTINIRAYRINSNNNYFHNYVQTQHNDGKGDTCNLLPYTYDFHLSGPVLLFDISVSQSGDAVVHYFDLDSQNVVPIPLYNENTNTTIFTPKILADYSDGITVEMFKNNGGCIDYNEHINKFRIKNKSHGKERGVTVRR